MRHLTDDTSNIATLMCSSGRIWNIKLRRAEERIYLHDGWKQFLKDNSLGDMEFLLFRYGGNMCFDVQIFQKNGCEKLEMPVTGKHKGVAVTQGKRKRGRPKKKLLSSLLPPRSCGDGPGVQLKYFFYEQTWVFAPTCIHTTDINVGAYGEDHPITYHVHSQNRLFRCTHTLS